MVSFGYTIYYVPDVAKTLNFFEITFGMTRRLLTEEGDYGELATGDTVLAFASHELGHANLPKGYVAASTSDKPLGVEIALVTDDVHAAHNAALAQGATELAEPVSKPWGQVVSYVRSPEGILLELCTPTN
jgi:catechol 2,3-dioxygenase-like lactoylglutathione lyase family enzyme